MPADQSSSEPASSPQNSAGRRPARTTAYLLGRLVAIGFVLLVVALLAAELAARIAFGFSMDEPIVILDAHCEYRLAPGVYQGGYTVNDDGMRSPPIPETKPDGEFRVLVLGDSVTEGSTDLTNDQLATNTAERALNDGPRDGTTFRVLNASVGSWSVVNQIGFIDAFGDFDADAIVLVFNTADATDGFGTPLAPTSQPICGLHRAVRLARIRFNPVGERAVFYEPDGIFAKANAAALNRLIDHAESRGIPLVAIWHPKKDELANGEDAARAQSMLDVFASRGVEIVRFSESLKRSASDSSSAGENPYADNIHLAAPGHRLLADLLVEQIRGMVPTPGESP